MLRSTDTIAHIFLAHGWASQLLRDKIMLPLLRSNAMQKRLARRMSQLDMNYRDLGLSAHQERGLLGRARVRAGDRTPDVLFRDAQTNQQTSLFAQLGRSRLVALCGAGERPERAARLAQSLGRLGIECFEVLPETRQPAGQGAGLIDATGDFRRMYGARGEFLYLIRPDGYVGLFQRPIDERALQTYLLKLFPAQAVGGAFAAPALGKSLPRSGGA